jgi:hypothetical protein
MADRSAWSQPQIGPEGFANTAKVFGGKPLAIIAGDIALNKTTGLLVVPKGFVVTDGKFVISKLDTGAALMLSIGDMAVPDRFMVAANTGQAGGTATLNPTGLFYEFLADTEVIMKATVAAAGWQAGNVTPYLFGFMLR